KGPIRSDSPRADVSVAPIPGPGHTAHAGLTMTLEGPTRMHIGERYVRFTMTVRNSSPKRLTFSTYNRMLAFYDSAGKLVTDLDDYFPDVHRMSPGLEDLLTLQPDECVQLHVRTGAFRGVPPPGQYLVEAVLRPNSWFSPDVF